MTTSSDLTVFIRDVEAGRRSADELLPLVYEELRVLARSRLARERPGQTLQPTALVHEAWMRLVGDEDPGWNGRGHFFGAAALAMRRILVEQARRKGRLRHGGDRERVELDDAEPVFEAPVEDVLAVDRALRKLEAERPRQARLVELRWFAGLTTPEAAEALEISVGTAERDWRFARAWLRTELAGFGGEKGPDDRREGASDGGGPS